MFDSGVEHLGCRILSEPENVSARAGLVTGPPFGCVPLGNTRCEASAFSPVTLLMRHIGSLTSTE